MLVSNINPKNPMDDIAEKMRERSVEERKLAAVSGSDLGMDKLSNSVESRNNEFGKAASDTVNISDIAREMQKAAKAEKNKEQGSEKDADANLLDNGKDGKNSTSMGKSSGAESEENSLDAMQKLLSAAQKELQQAQHGVSEAEAKAQSAETPQEQTSAKTEVQQAQMILGQKMSQVMALQQQMMEESQKK